MEMGRFKGGCAPAWQHVDGVHHRRHGRARRGVVLGLAARGGREGDVRADLELQPAVSVSGRRPRASFVADPGGRPSYLGMTNFKNRRSAKPSTLNPAALARVRGGTGLTSRPPTCTRECPPNCPNHDIIVFDIVD